MEVRSRVREEIQQILYRSNINSSLLFLVKDDRGKSHYIPMEGITSCLETLNWNKQRKLIDHCYRLERNPDALMVFLRRLASVVAKRRL